MINSQKIGKSLETLINMANQHYNEVGILAWQNHVEWVVIHGINGRISKAFTRGKSILDFSGIDKQGRYFEFDAKKTTKEYFDSHAIKLHQLERAIDLESMRCRTFFIVEVGNKVYKLDLLRAAEKPRKILPGEMKLLRSRNGCALDYLEIYKDVNE